MDREFSCFFTGHRAISKNRIPVIREATKKEVERLINDKGVVDFITGGALGFDTLAAEVIIDLKQKYNYIKLHLYLPCFDQMDNWSTSDQYRGRMIMSKADEKIYVTEGKYVTGCMKRRNKKMADDAVYGIAYMTNTRSGTAFTVGYAESIGDTVFNIAEEI